MWRALRSVAAVTLSLCFGFLSSVQSAQAGPDGGFRIVPARAMPPVYDYADFSSGGWAANVTWMKEKKVLVLKAWHAPSNTSWESRLRFPRISAYDTPDVEIEASGKRLVSTVSVLDAAYDLVPERRRTHLMVWNRAGGQLWKKVMDPATLVSVNEHTVATQEKSSVSDDYVNVCAFDVVTGEELLCRRPPREYIGGQAQLVGPDLMLLPSGGDADSSVEAVNYRTGQTAWILESEGLIHRGVYITNASPVKGRVMLRDWDPGDFDRLLIVDAKDGSILATLPFSDDRFYPSEVQGMVSAQHGTYLALNYESGMTVLDVMDPQASWTVPEGVEMAAFRVCSHVAWVRVNSEERLFDLRTKKFIGKDAPPIYNCLSPSSFVTARDDASGVYRYVRAKLPG